MGSAICVAVGCPPVRIAMNVDDGCPAGCLPTANSIAGHPAKLDAGHQRSPQGITWQSGFDAECSLSCSPLGSIHGKRPMFIYSLETQPLRRTRQTTSSPATPEAAPVSRETVCPIVVVEWRCGDQRFSGLRKHCSIPGTCGPSLPTHPPANQPIPSGLPTGPSVHPRRPTTSHAQGLL